MGDRPDLSYEEREQKVPYFFTDAGDIDEALEMAYEALLDVRSFRAYAKATGFDVVETKVVEIKAAEPKAASRASAFIWAFIAGVTACLIFLRSLGAI